MCRRNKVSSSLSHLSQVMFCDKTGYPIAALQTEYDLIIKSYNHYTDSVKKLVFSLIVCEYSKRFHFFFFLDNDFRFQYLV